MRIVGIATLKEREESFKRTIDSLYGQVDEIVAVLNLYSEVPEWLKALPKVKAIPHDNSLSDSGKFLRVAEYDNAYYYGCDDDLLYPSNWCDVLQSKVDQYHCPCSFHGKRYDLPVDRITSYRRNITKNFHCLSSCPSDLEVHVVGTGVCCFNTKDLKLSIEDFKYPHMADPQFSLACKKQGVRLMGIAHHAGWLTYMKPVGSTLWHTQRDDRIQTAILKEILK